MEGEDILTAIAEISIAFAGFSGIVSVIGRDRSTQWSVTDRIRFWSMLEFGIAALFFSLLPIPLRHFGLNPDLVWAVSSLLLGGFIAIDTYFGYRRGRKIAYRADGFAKAMRVVTAAILALLALNVARIGPGDGLAAYLCGLVYLLAIATSYFWRLLWFSNSPFSGSWSE